MTRSDATASDRLLEHVRRRLLARAAVRLAHDLNNDLTVIAGQVELAQRPGATRIDARLEQVRRAATDAADRSRLVLELARARPGDLQPAAADGVERDLLRLAQLLLGRDVELELVCRPGLVPVDPTPLRLLTGALMLASLSDARPHRPKLSLTLSRRGTDLALAAIITQAPPAPAWLSEVIAACGNGHLAPSNGGWQVVARIPTRHP